VLGALLAGSAALLAWHARAALDRPQELARDHAEQQLLSRRLAETERALAVATTMLASQDAPASAETVCAAVSPPEEPAPTPEQLRGASQGDAIVDAALVRASWRDEDSLALGAVENLSDADHARLLQRVAAAINADQLRVELVNQPF